MHEVRATPRGGGDHLEPDPAPWQAKDISVGHSPGVDEPARERPRVASGACVNLAHAAAVSTVFWF